jgi:hypothetical protein
VNAVTSGDFEDNQVWSVWDWAGQVNLSIEAFDGQAAARLGEGQGDTVTCPTGQTGQEWWIQQQVTVPAEGQPVLSFLEKITASRIDPGQARLEVILLTDGQPHHLIEPGEQGQPSDWQLTALDLSPWRGQTVEVQFRVVRCTSETFSVSLDRISLGARPRPVAPDSR